mgnify:CR=1 FL=1
MVLPYTHGAIKTSAVRGVYPLMNTQAINDITDIPEIKESPRSKSFNFSLDGNLGLQIGFLSGLGGILYYLFSCTCPS